MRRAAFAIIVLTVWAASAFAQSNEPAQDQERRDRIADNLKLQFEQLRSSDLRIVELRDADLEGFDQGVVVIDGRNAMRFLVTDDDKHLYLIVADAVDVSLSRAEVAAEFARLREEELKLARSRHEALLDVAAGRPSRGPADARITIFEFSDFQCPYCARVSGTIDQLLEKYDEEVRLVFMHMPLSRHRWAEPAAIAATCAGRQSEEAFWSLHDFYFENQSSLTAENVVDRTREKLKESNVALEVWNNCAADKTSADYADVLGEVRAESEAGRRHGVTGTPAFFINGHFLSGAEPLSAFDEIIAAIRVEDE